MFPKYWVCEVPQRNCDKTQRTISFVQLNDRSIRKAQKMEEIRMSLLAVLEGNFIFSAADFIADELTITKSRSKVLDFSVPYYQSQYRALVNSNYNPAKVSYFTYDVVSVKNFLAKYFASNATGAGKASEAGVGAAVVGKGVVSPKVSVSPVATLDLKGPSANLKEAVQRLLIEKSSLALIGETPSILFQYQSHKDQLKLLPDVLSNSYFALGIKKGNSALRNKLNEYINSIAEKGTLQVLTNKYVPSGCSQ